MLRALDGGRDPAGLEVGERAALEARVAAAFRINTYDRATGTVTFTAERAGAFAGLAAHYAAVFARGVDDYAIPGGT